MFELDLNKMRWKDGKNVRRYNKPPRQVRMMGKVGYGFESKVAQSLPKKVLEFEDEYTGVKYYSYEKSKCNECGGILRYDEHEDVMCEDCGLIFENVQENLISMIKSREYKAKEDSYGLTQYDKKVLRQIRKK